MFLLPINFILQTTYYLSRDSSKKLDPFVRPRLMYSWRHWEEKTRKVRLCAFLLSSYHRWQAAPDQQVRMKAARCNCPDIIYTVSWVPGHKGLCTMGLVVHDRFITNHKSSLISPFLVPPSLFRCLPLCPRPSCNLLKDPQPDQHCYSLCLFMKYFMLICSLKEWEG